MDASEEQILSLLKSGVTLNDIRLRSKKTVFSSEKLTHYNMKNFNVTIKEKLLDFIKISLPREEILIAIAIWFGYDLKDTSKKKRIKKILKRIKIQKFYCDNFLRLLSNSISLENKYLNKWCMENMENIIWDRDLMGDLENCYFENCIRYIDNEFFKSEFITRDFKNVFLEEVNPIKIIEYVPWKT